MAISTEATVRAVLVAAIQGIAGSLDFDDILGNVKDYPLEMHNEEKIADYLRAMVGGKQVSRCWAVDVRGSDDIFAVGIITKRTYRISITGYYLKGTEGAAYKDMIDHATKIRGAIRTISPSLGGTVNLLTSPTELSVGERNGTQTGRLLVGTMGYSATRTNPDF